MALAIAVTQFPETREGLIIQIKDPSNRDAWEQFVDIYRPVIHRIAVARGLQDTDERSDCREELESRAAERSLWREASNLLGGTNGRRRIATSIVSGVTRWHLTESHYHSVALSLSRIITQLLSKLPLPERRILSQLPF